MLELDSVQLSFADRNILSNVYLKCETGNIVGIMGRNGSGKSSILKLLFGTLRANSQSVRINGTYTNQLYRVKNAVHFVPQDGLFMDYLNFEEFVKGLHKRMYQDVWKWAGEFRRTEKNIGIAWTQTGVSLKTLLDDTEYCT